MFGKPKAPGSNDTRSSAADGGRGEVGSRNAAARAPELPRRSGNYALPGTRPGDQRMAHPGTMGQPSSPERQLVVGREIALSGEITACETLIVEGKVEADLKDCKTLQIAVSGLYKGAATVEQADISGHFDGELTVKGTLMLRSTGRVNGTLRYREMEIERGGKVSGSLQDIPSAKQAAETKPEPAEAPKAPKAPKADDLVSRAQSGGGADVKPSPTGRGGPRGEAVGG